MMLKPHIYFILLLCSQGVVRMWWWDYILIQKERKQHKKNFSKDSLFSLLFLKVIKTSLSWAAQVFNWYMERKSFWHRITYLYYEWIYIQLFIDFIELQKREKIIAFFWILLNYLQWRLHFVVINNWMKYIKIKL